MIAPELVKVEFPDSWLDIYTRFAPNMNGADVQQLANNDALIFPELIPPHGLGTGFYYNTQSSISQLAVALSVAPNHQISELAKRRDNPKALSALADELRQQRVLSGFKLLDLGCGEIPGLAIAAKSMGAEVHTVDGESIEIRHGRWVDTHTVVDLSAQEAVAAIQKNTDGEFDYITECIIGNVPGHSQWKNPTVAEIQTIGAQLLKPGGFLYQAHRDLLQKA